MVIVEQFGEGLRGMTLLEDVCPWGWALRFQNSSLSLSPSAFNLGFII